jgi:hypothetical protein
MNRLLSRRVDQLEQAVAMSVCSAGGLAGADATFPQTEDPAAVHNALVDQIRVVHDRTLEILRNAERVGRPDIALQCIREARSNVELLARLTGQLNGSAYAGNLLNVNQFMMIMPTAPQHTEAIDGRTQTDHAWFRDQPVKE